MTPSLTPDEQNQFLGGEERCGSCDMLVTKNYCRQCDEFFWDGHSDDCPRMAPGVYSEDHRGHRTY